MKIYVKQEIQRDKKVGGYERLKHEKNGKKQKGRIKEKNTKS